MRIDGHQHFWSLGRGDYGWLTPELDILYRDYGPANLEPLLADAGFGRTVLVQAAPTVAETRYLLGIADAHDAVAGVVGWADLERAAEPLPPAVAAHPKLVGIRPMLQDIGDPAWIARPALAPAVRWLEDRELAFDALVTPAHLPHLLAFLERHPGLRAVVDHGAKPPIADRGWQPWADGIAAIASNTSACCKLSGLLTEAAPDDGAGAIAPYVEHLLDVFGSDRLIWGSDWPVLNLARDYRGWLSMTEQLLATLDTSDREKIMGGNAVRFYGLELN